VSPPASSPGRWPARVGIVSPQEVVESGLRVLLDGVDDDWEVVSEGDGASAPDVVLYDVLWLHEGDGSDLEHLLRQNGSVVIAVVRDLRPDLEAQALDRGVAAAISIGVSGKELADVVRSALAGTLHESPLARRLDSERLLGSEAGLSVRESSVLRLIVQGHTNQEIAERLFLSINSIKTYIRTTYRKLGVRTRQQAVTWAIQHGFPIAPDAVRDNDTEERDPDT
jgi:DNA-binding NarL/FixJ family response regulator